MKLEDEGESYRRLKNLYGISKLLSTFKTIDETFPQILQITSKTFPLLTAVLIEHWEKTPVTVVWHSADATQEQIDNALTRARLAYHYLTGFKDDSQAQNKALERCSSTKSSHKIGAENIISLPLIVDELPALGVLQLEGSESLDMYNLEFVSALADLVSVALDRYYKSRSSGRKIIRSQNAVIGLEIQKTQRENFVSLLTHDLRQPIAAAFMAAHMILQKNEEPLIGILSNKIINSVTRADQMIKDLLDANRINSGEVLPIFKENFELHKLIKETIHELSEVYGERFIFKSTDTIEVFWDRKSIRRVIENLCNNAIKYGSKETPVTISFDQTSTTVNVHVQNFGEVIALKDQNNLFQQFKRAKATESTKNGWGIGLTLVSATADAHGGGITVASLPETGTVFTLSIPIKT